MNPRLQTYLRSFVLLLCFTALAIPPLATFGQLPAGSVGDPLTVARTQSGLQKKYINSSVVFGSGKTLEIENGSLLGSRAAFTIVDPYSFAISGTGATSIQTNAITLDAPVSLSLSAPSLTIQGDTYGPRTIYVATNGNDANAGTSASPKATLQAAVDAIGGFGSVLMKSGDYTATNAVANLDAAKTIAIAAEPNALVRVYLGETISSGFTADTSDSNVYYKVITTVIPAASDSTVWVFEDGTVEGTITAPHPLQRGRTARLPHYRLTVAASLAALRAGGNGSYFYDSGTSRLYIKATDAANLASSPKTYRIPSQTANRSFVYGATAAADVTIQGIEVYYGKDNFDLSGAAKFRLERCVSFGAGNCGMYAANFGHGEDILCEWAASANDGVATTNLTTNRISTLVSTDPWIHDNGDEGLSSGHGVIDEALHCLGTSYGGLFENQARGGGITTFYSRHVAYSPRTRGNLYGIIAAGKDSVDVYGLVSTGDANACWASASGAVLNVWSPTVLTPTSAVFSAGSGATVNAYHPNTDSLNLMHGGAGTTNVNLGLTPAFYAEVQGALTLTNGAFTRLTSTTEIRDATNAYASDRFTPGVAGYYLLGAMAKPSASATRIAIEIYKNGVSVRRFCDTATAFAGSGSCVVYLSATDYVDCYVYVSGAGLTTSTTATEYTYWWGQLLTLP